MINDNVERLKRGPTAYRIICDVLGFEPQGSKHFTFSDDSKKGNESLHCGENEYWYIKNFSTGNSFSSIDAYMLKHRLQFAEAVKELSEKYLNGHSHTNGHKNRKSSKPTKPRPFQDPVLRSVKDFKPEEIGYWQQFGITGKILQTFNVWAVDCYIVYSWNKNSGDWHGYPEKPEEKNGGLIFAYKVSDNCYKIYLPLHPDKSRRFIWVGEKPASFTDVWGVELIPESTDVVLITEGLKDALTINSHPGCFEQKVWAIAKESAGDALDSAIVAQLKSKYDLLLCLDADTPGREAAEKHAKTHGLRSVDLAAFITEELGYEVSPELKDVSDIFHMAYSQLMDGEKITDLRPIFSRLVEKVLTQAEPQPDSSMKEAPKESQTSALIYKTANQTLMDAALRPIPNKLWLDVWYEQELCILFADTNVGKSILAVQIADHITKELGKAAVICDFELSDKQFEARYSENYQNHYQFSDLLIRAYINPDVILPAGGSFETYLSDGLEDMLKRTGAKVLIIDNITYLSSQTEKAKDALPLMKELKALKAKYGLSILCLAHTPKRNLALPLTRNDLAGSKMLINFCDSAFAIGESYRDKSLRYVKQIKTRNGEFTLDSENVAVYQIEKPDNFLRFAFLQYYTEREHLREWTEKDRKELIESAKKLSAAGKTQRDIAKELGISLGVVNKYLNT